MIIQRKRVAKRLASGLLAGALALGGLAISGGSVSAKTLTVAGGNVVRVSGADRYATASAFADKLTTQLGGSWVGDIIVVSGAETNMADALSAIQLSKAEAAPILLTASNSLPTPTRDWLIANRAAIQLKAAPKVHVVGGTSAVSDAVMTEIVSTLNAGLITPLVTSGRYSGDSRYATNKAVNALTGMLSNTDKVYVVGGSAIADALSIGAAVYDNGVLVMTNGTSLSADAAATLTSYAALNTAAGTSPSITIVGGPSAVSYAVEEAIVAISGINYRNITRIQGASRYATNLAVETATSQGNKVIFASGTTFADALVASPLAGELNIDLVLMPPTGPTTDYGTLLYSATDMWVAGGTAAVSDALLTGAITAKASPAELTTTLTCAEGATSVSVTFQGTAGVSPDIAAAGGEGTTIKNVSHFTVNGVAATAASADLGAVALDATTGAKTVSIEVSSSALTAGSTVSFAGLVEAASSNNRKITGSSCTVADDATAPTFAISAAEADASGVAAFFVQASEPVPYTNGLGVMATAGTVDTKFEATDIAIAAGTGDAIPVGTVDAKVTALDGVGGLASLFLVSVGTTLVGTDDALDAGNTIAIDTGGVKDVAGNANVAMTPIAVATDAVAPTMAAGSATCTGTGKSAVTVGGFKLEAALATSGVSLNGWKLNVVDVPSQTVPSVVVDAEAKSVTVSADQYRVKADDVVAWVNSHKAIPANWVFSRDAANAAPGTLTPTTALSANATTGGTQTCVLTLTSSELIQDGTVLVGQAGAVAPTATLTLNGVAIAAPTVAATANLAGITVTKTGLTAGGNFVVTWVAEDVAGNSGGNSVAIAG